MRKFNITMKTLNKNYWRLAWITLVNGAIIIWFVTDPIRQYHDEGQIFQALRALQPPFSFRQAFLEKPLMFVFLVVLAAGVVEEVRRSVLAAILNVVPFLLPLPWVLVDWMQSQGSYRGERELGLALSAGLFLVGLVNAIFYVVAFRNPDPT